MCRLQYSYNVLAKLGVLGLHQHQNYLVSVDMCVRRVGRVGVRELTIRGHGERLRAGGLRGLSELHGRGGVRKEKIGREEQGDETARGQ